jgi:phosphoribosyl-ATP pyrophosphohydrolase
MTNQNKPKFTLQELYNKIVSRKLSANEGSYTKKLFENELLLKRKLIEEAAEVITAKNKKELIWECSDLIYFLFVIMAKERVTVQDVERENFRRNKNSKKLKRKSN